MHNAGPREPVGRRDVHARIVVGVGGGRKRARVVAGAEQDGPALRDREAGLLHRGVEILRRDFGARLDVAQVDADAANDAVLQRVFVDRHALFAEVARRIDVRAAVIGHRDEHDAVAVHVARLGKSLLVGLPHAVDDRRLARIARRAVIELA
jgi:hypothetical protein